MSAKGPGRHARTRSSIPLFQQSFLLALSNATSAGGGFIAWSTAAHYATPDAIGIATGLFASCSFLSYMTSLAFPYGLLHYGHGRAGPRIFYQASVYTSVTSVVAAVIFATGSVWWDPSLTPWLDYGSAIALFCLFNIVVSISTLIDAYLVAHRRAGLAFGRNFFVALAKIGGIAAIAKTGTLDAAKIYCLMLAPLGLSVFLITAAFGVGLLTYRPQADDEDLLRTFFSYSVRTFPSALLDGAPLFLLPVLALRLVGPVDNAYFYVAWSVSGVIGLLATSVGQVALRETSSVDNYRSIASRATQMAMSVTVATVTVLLVSARLILEIFGSKYASEAVGPLRILLISAIPAAYVTVNMALFRGQKRFRSLTIASVVYAVMSISATVICGALAGLTGVCVGWLIGMSLSALAMAFISTHNFDQSRLNVLQRIGGLEDRNGRSKETFTATLGAETLADRPSWTLLGVTIVVWLLVVWAPTGALRAVGGIPLLFYLPGFALLFVVRSGRLELSAGILALASGISVGVVIVTGLMISLATGHVSRPVVATVLAGITAVSSVVGGRRIIAAHSRRGAPITREQFKWPRVWTLFTAACFMIVVSFFGYLSLRLYNTPEPSSSYTALSLNDQARGTSVVVSSHETVSRSYTLVVTRSNRVIISRSFSLSAGASYTVALPADFDLGNKNDEEARLILEPSSAVYRSLRF